MALFNQMVFCMMCSDRDALGSRFAFLITSYASCFQANTYLEMFDEIFLTD